MDVVFELISMLQNLEIVNFSNKDLKAIDGYQS